MPAIEGTTIARAVWISTAVATCVAVVLAVFIYLLHRRMQRSTKRTGVAWLATSLALVAAYTASGLVLIGVIRLQFPQRMTGDLFAASIVYVDPGMLQRLLPLAGIVLTWGFLTIRSRNMPVN